MRAQLPRELHAYGDMVGNREGLNTGAPSITYQGQEGPQAGGQPRPEEIIIQLQEAYKQHVAQGGQLTFEEFVEVVMNQNQNRQQAAYGGIMGVDGRRQYGIGSWFQKKVMDPIKGTVKKAIDNPLVSAAALGTLANYKDIIPGERDSTDWFNNVLRGITGRGKTTGAITEAQKKADEEFARTGDYDVYSGIKSPTQKDSNWIGAAKDIVGSGIGAALSNPNILIPMAGVISGAFAKEDDPGYTGQGTGLNIRDIGKIANITDEKQGQAAGLRFLPEVSARKYTPEEMISTYATTEAEDFSTPETKAKGGRIGYDMGGDVGEWEMPEQFLEDFKRRDIDKFLEDFRIPYYMKTFNVDEDEAIEMIMDNTYYSKEGIKRPSGRIGYDMGGATSYKNLLEKKGYKDMMQGMSDDEIRSLYDSVMGTFSLRRANGGRIPAQEGGLMDLGGMEKDYREEGGFVPIGGKEKADDVPARLSKNEFVFTADAVRNAGGGDIDEGAAIMERMMKNLEQGGQVSEESQGLEGAREMFETSQRLEKRII